MKVVIALGANLGDPKKQISLAIDAIRDCVKVNKISRLYETAPFKVSDNQPNYINAVLIGETELQPKELMKELLAIEAKLGRQRAFPKAARTIDLDIIDYEGFYLQSDELTLPHPRAFERKFVLEPWAEIDPTAELPGFGPVSELLAALNQPSRLLLAWYQTRTGAVYVKETKVLTDLDRPCAFVPTMGALHAGHQSLIRRAREFCDEVVVSVFVNPLQFEDKDDLAKYPKTPEIDAQLAKDAGATILWRPDYETIYPNQIKRLTSGELGNKFEGVHRPGHFDGVLTVVNRLFELVRPRYAIFGEKDFQQLFLITKMAAQLHPEIEIVPAPTIREANGLAMSSRNVRLNSESRKAADVISQTLRAAATEESIESARLRLNDISREERFTLDYAEIIDEDTFEIATEESVRRRAIIAGWIDGVRLIDNMAMKSALVRA